MDQLTILQTAMISRANHHPRLNWKSQGKISAISPKFLINYSSSFRHQLLTNGDLDLKSTTLETFKSNSGRRANIEKPRNHLMTTGDIDLKTTTSENFHFDGKFEKVEKVRRDNLKLTGERQLRTTHHDYKVIFVFKAYSVKLHRILFLEFWRNGLL